MNRLHSGEATEQDAAAFVLWRTQSRAHEEAFRAAVRLRELVRSAEANADAARSNERDTIIRFDAAARQRRVSRRGMIGGALAASMAGGVYFAGRGLDIVPTPAEALADYRTGPGERRLIRLAEGASVDLNTRTSVDIRKGAAVPTVELVSGEAMLSGGSAGAALTAGAGRSLVRSGRFNARRDGSDVCITCLAGEVEVAWRAEKRLLRVAEEVRYDSAGIGAVMRAVDPVAVAAWQSGTLIFRNMPMRQVVREISRYRTGKIFLANPALGARALSGTYYINRLDDFFSQAELAFGVKVSRLPGNIVILS